MTQLRAIDGGRHRGLRRYGLAMDADIPPLLAGSHVADVILKLAKEIRTRRLPRREWRVALAHLRSAWIGHCCGNLALCELEGERAWAVCLRNSPLFEIAGKKMLSDQQRKFALLAKNRKRNSKIRELAAQGTDTDALRQRFGISARHTRRLKGRGKR